MKCVNCGNQLTEGMVYCNFCGSKIEWNKTERLEIPYSNNTENRESVVSIVSAAQHGNQSAMEALIEKSSRFVNYHCFRFLRNREDALDATQEIFIIVCNKLWMLKEPEAYWGWLKTMTVNFCKNRLIKMNRQIQIDDVPDDEELEQLAVADDQQIPHVVADETRNMVLGAIDSLPDAQKICVLMYYYDEMKVSDISDSIGVSEGTIKSRLFQARKHLKSIFESYAAQGVKLYGVTPLGLMAYIAYFLKKGESVIPALNSEILYRVATSGIKVAHLAELLTTTNAAVGTVSAAAGNIGGGAAMSAGAGSTAASSATTAGVFGGSAAAATGVSGVAAATGAGFFGTIAGKIVIGIAAASLLTGGTVATASVVKHIREVVEIPAQVEEVLSSASEESFFSYQTIEEDREEKSESLAIIDNYESSLGEVDSEESSETISKLIYEGADEIGISETEAKTCIEILEKQLADDTENDPRECAPKIGKHLTYAAFMDFDGDGQLEFCYKYAYTLFVDPDDQRIYDSVNKANVYYNPGKDVGGFFEVWKYHDETPFLFYQYQFTKDVLFLDGYGPRIGMFLIESDNGIEIIDYRYETSIVGFERHFDQYYYKDGVKQSLLEASISEGVTSGASWIGYYKNFLTGEEHVYERGSFNYLDNYGWDYPLPPDGKGEIIDFFSKVENEIVDHKYIIVNWGLFDSFVEDTNDWETLIKKLHSIAKIVETEESNEVEQRTESDEIVNDESATVEEIDSSTLILEGAQLKGSQYYIYDENNRLIEEQSYYSITKSVYDDSGKLQEQIVYEEGGYEDHIYFNSKGHAWYYTSKYFRDPEPTITYIYNYYEGILDESVDYPAMGTNYRECFYINDLLQKRVDYDNTDVYRQWEYKYDEYNNIIEMNEVYTSGQSIKTLYKRIYDVEGKQLAAYLVDEAGNYKETFWIYIYDNEGKKIQVDQYSLQK